MADPIQEEINKEVATHKILIYGKGTKQMPMCGFTKETMPRKPPARTLREIDPAALAEFQAGLRKRYSDAQILGELPGAG